MDSMFYGEMMPQGDQNNIKWKMAAKVTKV